MKCPEIDRWILLSMDLLDEPETRRMREHLESCPSCRELFDEARGGHAELTAAYEAMNLGHDMLRERLITSLPAESPRSVSKSLPARGWRLLGGIIMNHPRTSRAAALFTVAAAAVLILTLFINGNGQLAFGRVVERLKDVKTMVCRTLCKLEAIGHPVTLEGKVLMSSDHGVRCDITLFGREVWTLCKPVGEPMLVICPPFRCCIAVPVGEEGTHHPGTFMKQLQTLTGDAMSMDRMMQPDAFLEQLKTMTADASVPLGPSVIDGRGVEGFEVAPEKVMMPRVTRSIRLYVDAATALPVQIVIELSAPGSGLAFDLIYDRFEWHVPLAAGLFRPEIPGDYARSSLVFPTADEDSLVDGLRYYAELTGGDFPEGLDIGPVAAVLNQRAIAYIAGWCQDPNSYLPAFQDLPRKLLTVVSACRFHGQLNREGRAPEYFGDTVDFGDAGSILLRWKLDDGKVRLIHGDLSAETVNGPE